MTTIKIRYAAKAKLKEARLYLPTCLAKEKGGASPISCWAREPLERE